MKRVRIFRTLFYFMKNGGESWQTEKGPAGTGRFHGSFRKSAELFLPAAVLMV